MHCEIVLAYSIRCRVNPGYSRKARRSTTWAQALPPVFPGRVADGEPEAYQPLPLYTRWPAVRPPSLVRKLPLYIIYFKLPFTYVFTSKFRIPIHSRRSVFRLFGNFLVRE